MTLSEHEQHVLEEIERTLVIENPALADRLTRVRLGRCQRHLYQRYGCLAAGALAMITGAMLENDLGVAVAMTGYLMIVAMVVSLAGCIRRE